MNKSEVTCKYIEEYLDNHITEGFNLTVISQRFGLSKHYLCHLFKANTGYSLLEYIREKRLLLVQSYYESGMSLLDAAMKAGFKNYSSFYKACRSEFGEAPSKISEMTDARNKQA